MNDLGDTFGQGPPPPESEPSNDRLKLALISLGALVAVVLIVLIIVLLSGDDETDVAADTSSTEASSTSEPATSSTSAATTTTTTAATTTTTAATTTTTTAATTTTTTAATTTTVVVALPSFVTDDCIGYDPATLVIEDLGATGWRLNAGSSALVLYDNETDALRGLAVAGNYNELCFIGRANTRPDRGRYISGFWYGDSGTTVAIPEPQDCIGYDPATLAIENLGADGWRLNAGSSALVLYDNEIDALRGQTLAEAFSDYCFIGRGNTRPDRDRYISEYWK